MKLKILALAATLTFGAPAFAENVQITGFTFSPATPLSVSSPSYSGQAGQFSGLLNGNSFVTYCTDPSQILSFGVLYTDYSVIDGVTAWGAQKSSDLDRAISHFMALGTPTNAAESAAAQAIVWEVIFEGSSSYDLAAGTFTATSVDAATQALLSSVDWGAIAAEPVTYHVDQLYSREHQDLMVITQVPEPGTYALFAAGLAGMCFVASRRSRRA